MSEAHPTQQEQLADFNEGMKVAAAAIGNAIAAQELARGKPRFETKAYADGAESELEVWDVTGQEVDLNTHTQSGLAIPRSNGSVELKRPLTEAPDGNGRSAVFFDDGKSIFFQDGVGYVFGSKDQEGNTGLLRQIAVDEIPAVKVGARDSFWINGLGKDGAVNRTNVTGKPIAVAIESLRQ